MTVKTESGVKLAKVIKSRLFKRLVREAAARKKELGPEDKVHEALSYMERVITRVQKNAEAFLAKVPERLMKESLKGFKGPKTFREMENKVVEIGWPGELSVEERISLGPDEAALDRLARSSFEPLEIYQAIGIMRYAVGDYENYQDEKKFLVALEALIEHVQWYYGDLMIDKMEFLKIMDGEVEGSVMFTAKKCGNGTYSHSFARNVFEIMDYFVGNPVTILWNKGKWKRMDNATREQLNAVHEKVRAELKQREAACGRLAS